MKLVIKLLIAVVLFFYVQSVSSQGRHESSVLVIDAERKLMMGFSEKQEIYEFVNTELSDYQADKYQKEINGGTIVRTAYMGVEAHGRTGEFEYGTMNGTGDIYRISASEMFADILLTLPEAANFNFLRVWGLDTNVSQEMVFMLYEQCLPFSSPGIVSTTVLGTVTSYTISGGNFSALIDLTQDGITIDNTLCTYTLRTRFDTTDDTLVLFKVRAQTYVF